MRKIVQTVIVGIIPFFILFHLLGAVLLIIMSMRSSYLELTLERIVPVKKTVIGKTFLFIPPENVVEASTNRRITTNRIFLYFSLPAIGPAFTSSSSVDSYNHILNYIPIAINESKIIAAYIDQSRNEKEDYSSDPNFMKLKGWYRASEPSDINGMDRYYQEHVQINDPTYSKPVIYLPTGTENKISIYLECSAIPDPKNPFCKLYDFNFPHGMSGYITLPLRYLNDWQSIHGKVVEKLREFIQAGDEKVRKK